jgi:hypothetical protein
MKEVTFKELTLTKIEKTFGLKQVRKCALLQEWENEPITFAKIDTDESMLFLE